VVGRCRRRLPWKGRDVKYHELQPAPAPPGYVKLIVNFGSPYLLRTTRPPFRAARRHLLLRAHFLNVRRAGYDGHFEGG
jgi:hypothetical protein